MRFEPPSAGAGGILSPGAPPHWRAGALEGVRHGFFGRQGGVSQGIYASLNAGTGSRDDPEAVRENRRRIAAAFGAAPDHLLGVHQVHSALVARAEDIVGKPRPEADALIATTPGLVISVLTADCAPVLLAEPEAGVVGAAHAGWKGALGGVLEAAIAAMVAAGAARARITAAVGPTIAMASYEVGPEFEARFLAADGTNAAFFAPRPDSQAGDRLNFDLTGYCVAQLQRSGINRVESLALDTYALPEALFSHRRSVHEKADDYGRNCAAITLS